jgi:vancomycin resistance protein YoaR
MYVQACQRVYPGIPPPRVSPEFVEKFRAAMQAAVYARARLAKLLRSGSGKKTLRAADFEAANSVTVTLPPEARLKTAVTEEPKKVTRRLKKAKRVAVPVVVDAAAPKPVVRHTKKAKKVKE